MYVSLVCEYMYVSLVCACVYMHMYVYLLVSTTIVYVCANMHACSYRDYSTVSVTLCLGVDYVCKYVRQYKIHLFYIIYYVIH